MQPHTPRRLIPITLSHSSRLLSAVGAMWAMTPALLNAASRLPNSEMVRSTIAATCASSPARHLPAPSRILPPPLNAAFMWHRNYRAVGCDAKPECNSFETRNAVLKIYFGGPPKMRWLNTPPKVRMRPNRVIRVRKPKNQNNSRNMPRRKGSHDINECG